MVDVAVDVTGAGGAAGADDAAIDVGDVESDDEQASETPTTNTATATLSTVRLRMQLAIATSRFTVNADP